MAKGTIDNHHFLQNLQVIKGYRIDNYVKTFGIKYKFITAQRSLKNAPDGKYHEAYIYSNGESNNEIPEFGFVDKDFNKRMINRLSMEKAVRAYIDFGGYINKFLYGPIEYSFFDYKDHKLIFVNAATGKIMSRS